jgi:arylformamidase
MPIWDLTEPLRAGMPTYPGDPPFERRVLRRLEDGDPYTLSWLGMSAHAGTHVDPPAHFLAGGATVDQLPLEALVGEALLVDSLDAAAADTRILLLRAGGAPIPTPELPGLRTFGIDAATLDLDAHRLLAGRGLAVVVNLRLDAIPAGRYRFACLPLLVEDGDGAPARAILYT